MESTNNPPRDNSKTYVEKLNDPRWQKKKNKILDRDFYICQFCGDGNSTLHVHHKKYNKGEPWEIEDRFLITLCQSCHEKEPEAMNHAMYTLRGQLMKRGVSSIEIEYMRDKLEQLPEDFWDNYESNWELIVFVFINPEIFRQVDTLFGDHFRKFVKVESNGTEG